ncbi:MAG TPA: hypothetical protein VNO21_10755, partial [Polyangiaceae bacterium]|nr:hypothetical protein [Polyangiaceae bacterium]
MSLRIKRHLTSIVFILAALLVTIYAYVVDRGKVSDPERTARGAALFPAFRRDEITRIELARAAAPDGGSPADTLVLERAERGASDDRGKSDGGEDGDREWRM